MPVIDGLVVAGCIGIVVLGGVFIQSLRKKAKPEIQGAKNTEAVRAAEFRRCQYCNKETNTKTDLYVNSRWTHRTCYLAASEKSHKESN